MTQTKASKRIAILYGSETGNAHDFASILSYKLRRLHFAHTLSTIGNYSPSHILNCKYLFVICSTTGQGEIPRNGQERSDGTRNNTLWSFLKRKDLPEDFLSHVHVSFLGLGDSSYPKFNYAIKKLHERIVNQLGAKELFARLEADEQCLIGSNKGTGAGIEAVYFEFEKKTLKYLCDTFSLRKLNGELVKRQGISTDLYLEPISSLKKSDETENMIHNTEPPRFLGDDNVKIGTVLNNKRITAEPHFQDVRQFVFKGIEHEEYYPGDTISMYPCNSDEAVNQFLSLQPHWSNVADMPLEFNHGIPPDLMDGGLIGKLTLRGLLKYHCDIESIPRASFFMKIWTFATEIDKLERGREQLEQQREKLRQFAYDEDMQDLFDYCNRPRRSILEVIEDFGSLKLPWEHMTDYLPIIKPRYFSISSAPCDPNIELTIAIVKYKTILRRIRKGVCTEYVSKLAIGDSFRYKVQNKGTFHHNLKKKSMILVSPGVGIAPMMCLIRSNICKDISLFFGNRYKEHDFLYESTLREWHNDKKISLYTCFSRDKENSSDIKYVQDNLWKFGEEMTRKILNNEALIFICGSSGKMPIQVRLTFVEMLKKWGNFEEDEQAADYLRQMEKNYRYLQETW
ncbi:hypothetical protein HG535_0A02540 [Zygotorulaspora mrakii]|uniref:NADPH-dependent diflavin oxidoreductase 1 n=1 Tax=Zygotorulaspora mrakii TaxID=42260 RepID=A0A7H9AVG0_ZYGMR|nr:uncharacterized protein HG535_0A02540 [Zygotorulaspora mrakii]QLG70316.1 hypothetical protein HG535_0A02540 [Zygotorulaspora mrakii]